MGQSSSVTKNEAKYMIRCPFCASERNVWRGWRNNASSRKRMKLCKSCGRKFTPDDGFLRMRFRPEIIKKALEMRKKGFSSSEVKVHLQRYEGAKVSRWTIIKWERKFRQSS